MEAKYSATFRKNIHDNRQKHRPIAAYVATEHTTKHEGLIRVNHIIISGSFGLRFLMACRLHPIGNPKRKV
jgi:hypothetical protein